MGAVTYNLKLRTDIAVCGFVNLLTEHVYMDMCVSTVIECALIT